MSTYLQRLLDRATLATPSSAGVQPSGLSHSPVSLSDQRLNDPDFADRYVTPADGRERFGDTMPKPPRPAPRRAPPRPAAETAPFESAVPRPNPVPPQIAETSPETPVTEASPPAAPPQHPRPVGLVDVADLVLPDPEPASERDEVAPPPPPPARPTTTDVQTELTEPPLPEPQRDRAPAHAPVEFAEATPAPPGPRSELIPVVPGPDLPAPEESAEAPSAPKPRPPVEALPPPVDVPALPDPPVSTPRQPDPASPPTPAVQAVKEPPESAPPAETRRTRPMTAAENSIIDPLTPRRRALTIFGLRRR